MCNTDDKNLPYLLANQEYDVWIINFRGNKHSRSHQHLSTSSYEFWNYSFHEMGSLDLPASIDFILKETLKEKIILIAHSQGATSFISAATLLPSYFLSKVEKFIGLGPVVKLDHIESFLIKTIGKFRLDFVFEKLGVTEMFPSGEKTNWITNTICSAAGFVCKSVAELVCDKNIEDENLERLDVIFSHFPSGTSLKSLSHFGQIMRSRIFQQFDYGKEVNIKTYGTEKPPQYDLTKYPDIKTHLIVGNDDLLADPLDTKLFYLELNKKVTAITYDLIQKASHISFLVGKSSDIVVKVMKYVNDNK